MVPFNVVTGVFNVISNSRGVIIFQKGLEMFRFPVVESPLPSSETQGQLVGAVEKFWRRKVTHLLDFSSPEFFPRPFRLFPAPTNCPWVSEDASLRFPNVKIIAVPATGFINDFG